MFIFFRICRSCPGNSFSIDSDNCLPCQLCSPGQKEISPCTPDNDRRCDYCPDGYYSTDGFACFPCTQCDETQLELHPCTRMTDRICAGKFFRKIMFVFFFLFLTCFELRFSSFGQNLVF